MPISPESDYCLHGAVSLLEMTADIDAGARRSRLDIDDIIDRSPAYRPGQPDIFAQTVTREVLAWRRDATPIEKAHMGWAGLLASECQFEEAIGGATNQLLDLYLAGISAPQNRFLPRAIPRGLEDLRLTRPEDVTLASHVVRVMTHGQLGNWLGMMAAQHHRVIEGILGISPRDYATAVRHDLDMGRLQREAAVVERAPERKASFKPADRRVIQKGRKAARKGVALYGNIFGEEGIRTFLRGDTLRIEGAVFDYWVQKTMDVIQHSTNPTNGHIPYRLDIHNKAGDFLAGGCVYFKETPVIDQIIGLSLHVRDKESELELLRETNMSMRSDAYYNDPILPALKEEIDGVRTQRLSDAEERDFRASIERLGGIDNLPVIRLGEEVEGMALYPASVSQVTDALRPHARRAVTQMLPNLMAIPAPVLAVMMAPPVRADDFYRLQLPALQLGLENTMRSIEA